MINDIDLTPSQEKLKDYLEDCQKRGNSLSTLISKRQVLSRVEREIGLFVAKPEDVEAFLKDKAPATQQTYLAHIQDFYRWIVESDPKRSNPASKVYAPRVQRKDPMPINPKDLDKALETAKPVMRAWLLLGAAAGLRCLEIAQLKPRDIHLDDLENPYLHIPSGKGGKSRNVPLHLEVVKALIVLQWPIRGKMWPNLTAHSLSCRINYHLKAVGSPATAHKLRHYAATNYWRALVESGYPDLLLLTDFLGHSSPVVSMIYTRTDHRRGNAAMKHMKIGHKAQEFTFDPSSRLLDE